MQIARAESAAARVVDRANVNLIYKTNLDARAPEPTVVRSDDVVGIFNEAHRGVLARVIAEQRKEMHSHVKDAVGRLEREIFVLRSEFALERQVRALHDEVAAARAEVPKLPAIEARVNAKQSKLAAEQARLERELAKNQKAVSKLRVDQAQADYRLSQHIKQSSGAAVELHFQTSQNSFVVRDLHPDAAAAWRDFCNDLATEQQNRASLRIVDPTSPSGLVIGLPVRRNPGYGA